MTLQYAAAQIQQKCAKTIRMALIPDGSKP